MNYSKPISSSFFVANLEYPNLGSMDCTIILWENFSAFTKFALSEFGYRMFEPFGFYILRGRTVRSSEPVGTGVAKLKGYRESIFILQIFAVCLVTVFDSF